MTNGSLCQHKNSSALSVGYQKKRTWAASHRKGTSTMERKWSAYLHRISLISSTLELLSFTDCPCRFIPFSIRSRLHLSKFAVLKNQISVTFGQSTKSIFKIDQGRERSVFLRGSVLHSFAQNRTSVWCSRRAHAFGQTSWARRCIGCGEGTQ